MPGKTFGPVKDLFKKTFKNQTELFECLEPAGIDRVGFYEYLDSVNTARNDAAHSHFLVAVWLQDITEDYPDQETIDRFVARRVRKDVEGCDWFLHYPMFLRAQLFREDRLFFTDVEESEHEEP